MRNINIDRDPVSSEEISTFKDFKSILRKHAQTTEDLAKIKPASNAKVYWISGAVVATITIASLFFIGEEKASPIVEEKPTNVVVQKEKIEWKLMMNSSNDPIHEHFDFDQISAERIEYIPVAKTSDIKDLIPNIKVADIQYVQNKQVFRLDGETNLNLSANKNLYQLRQGSWVKVNNNPIELPTLVKPRRAVANRLAIKLDFIGFPEEYKEFQNMYWQPVSYGDLDDLESGSEWTDGGIEETNVKGIYQITIKNKSKTKKFNGYPVLQKYAYKKAMKEYNKELLKQQEELKNAPKSFSINRGVYTIE